MSDGKNLRKIILGQAIRPSQLLVANLKGEAFQKMM
jgi:hypothetical protein